MDLELTLPCRASLRVHGCILALQERESVACLVELVYSEKRFMKSPLYSVLVGKRAVVLP